MLQPTLITKQGIHLRQGAFKSTGLLQPIGTPLRLARYTFTLELTASALVRPTVDHKKLVLTVKYTAHT